MKHILDKKTKLWGDPEIHQCIQHTHVLTKEKNSSIFGAHKAFIDILNNSASSTFAI